ncbi:MAG: glycogen/starch synthase [Trueperaceae bacterium]
MRILFASSEVYPYSKTGGLADVVGALPAALARLGHEVLVISPWYSRLQGGVPLWIGDIEFPFDGGTSAVGVGTLERDAVRLAFVGHEDFRRDQIYGYPDDVRRFCRFTRAIPQVAARLGFEPEVIHVHDWHTAYLPMVLRYDRRMPDSFPGLPSVLTIHNAQYQGVSGIDETLRWLELSPDLRDSWIEHLGQANALNAGSGFADRITTVSASYAQELLTPEFGYTLESTFRELRHKLVGILNGIDSKVWDPGRDPHLPVPYSAGDLRGKSAAKRAVCERFGLDPQRPLLGVVSRLAQQKGIDVLLQTAPKLREQGWSLFVLGTGESALEQQLRELAQGGVLSAELDYDESLAHLVYAGSDALAIPSRFEPCGLSQLIAMRYGTLPLARATGGLRDTISHRQTGFLFSQLNPRALATAAQEAHACYGSPAWATMMSAAMDQDFSWTRSALSYEELYSDLRSNR